MSQNARTYPHPVILPDFGISVFESTHSPQFEMVNSTHTFYEIGFVLNGRGRLVMADSPNGSSEIRSRDFFFIPPGTAHVFEDDSSKPLTIQMLCFDEHACRNNPCLKKELALLKQVFREEGVINLGDSYGFHTVFGLFRSMIFEHTSKRAGYELIVQSRFTELIVVLRRISENQRQAATGKEHNFNESVRYLEEKFYDSPSIEYLAAMAGMSYRSYTGHFRKRFEVSVKQYLIQLKITYAKKRLEECKNIEVAALDAGFNDLPNFYRLFKREVGQTPKAYLSSLEL